MGEAEVTEDVTAVGKDVGTPMMVEQGYLDLRADFNVAKVVVVLAESIPSWLLLVPLLGCQTLVVYVSQPVGWFRPPPP